MNLLRHRQPGRHRADAVAAPRPRGLVTLPARHARRPQIVGTFTGWAATARICADAAAHPVVDLRIACPAKAQLDLDMTQPIFLEIPSMTSSRAFTDTDVSLLLADIALTGGAE